MTITRNVVRDLLPLYAAGEASPDTRTLVETFVKTDPELSALLDSLKEDTPVPRPLTSAGSRAQDLVGLERTKDLLRQRTGFLAAAVVFTTLPFTFVFGDGGLRFLMLRDAPLVAMPLLGCGLSFWIMFGVTVRRLRVRGL